MSGISLNDRPNFSKSYNVLLQATRIASEKEFKDAIFDIRKVLDSFPGAITIIDVLATTLAVPSNIAWFFTMSSRYPEETVMNALRSVADEYQDIASIVWLEVTNNNL